MQDEQESEIIDLGYDVTEDEVKKALLKKGVYRGRCNKVYKKGPNDNGNTFYIIEWELTEPVPMDKVINGKKDLAAGFHLWPQRILANPSGGMTEDMIRDKMKAIHFALAGEGRVNTGAWVGKEALLTISFREAGNDKTGTYREASNEVDRVNPLKK